MKKFNMPHSRINYRIVFVDFDNTLCVHSHPIDYTSNLLESKEDACTSWFKESYLDMTLVEYLVNLKETNCKIILLSNSGSKQLEVKKYFCEKYVPDLFDDYVGCSCDCSKYDFIKAYLQKHDLVYVQCLLIDDSAEIINKLERDKICRAIPPQLVSYK